MKERLFGIIFYQFVQTMLTKTALKKSLVFSCACLLLMNANGQDKVYKLNRRVEIPVTAGLFAFNFYGFYLLGEKPTLDSLQILSLDQNDVWEFDRRVFSQSHPAPSYVYTVSDIGLWGSYVLPALLFIDKEIRKDWLDITVLYFETQAINLNIYLYGGPVFTKRIRPFVYIDGSSWDDKLDKGTTDSFFSGHASMTAGATFFMAKVLSDYHPELGGKKYLLYAAALVPPVLVGYCRYRGFMHFSTDIILGTAIGAAVGVLNPHLHKITKNKDLSIVPFTGGYSGLAVSLKF